MKTSVVMPVHGSWPVARRALTALYPQLGESRELIVVDDASPEPAPGDLDATVVRNERNVGFGPSCNRGAEQARGELILFLNSDALVEPGALDALEAAAASDGIGAVGAVLLNEDRSVQEAGSAIGREGTTYPLAAGATIDDPRWAFRREADYASAACLLVSKAAFGELGGFDDRYAPGYYEDADLCLRFADSGRRTIVEPAARAVHLQWGSGTRDRARTLVRRNQRRFVESWGERFAHRPVVVAAKPWPHRQLALRDAIPLLRLLVFEDAALARDVAGRWPGSRVTIVASAQAGDSIEAADPNDPEAWLEERRFHYSAVLNADERLDGALRRSQPQSARGLDDPRLPPPGEEPRG